MIDIIMEYGFFGFTAYGMYRFLEVVFVFITKGIKARRELYIKQVVDKELKNRVDDFEFEALEAYRTVSNITMTLRELKSELKNDL